MVNIFVDCMCFYFMLVFVNIGLELVLFDVGFNGQVMLVQIEVVGYIVDQIDKVIIIYMYGDYIGGFMGDVGEIFVGVEYVFGVVENNFWVGQDNKNYKVKVMLLVEKFFFVFDGVMVVFGIMVMDVSGYMSGYMVYMLESNGVLMFLGVDFVNYYVWLLGYFDWEVCFDMDKLGVVVCCWQILDMLVMDKIFFIGYYMLFLVIGYVFMCGDGFEYELVIYQLMFQVW